jgi:hypothetical protein
MAEVKPVETAFLTAIPPASVHSVTFHIPDWASTLRFRDGDAEILKELKNVYPRFGLFGPTSDVSKSSGD